jgi:hypothetical protein
MRPQHCQADSVCYCALYPLPSWAPVRQCGCAGAYFFKRSIRASEERDRQGISSSSKSGISSLNGGSISVGFSSAALSCTSRDTAASQDLVLPPKLS